MLQKTMNKESPPDSGATGRGKMIDFSVNGLVRIRLQDAGPSDSATVGRQLGLPSGDASGEPDIVIRFVNQLTITSSLRYLKKGEAGFTDDAFIVLGNKSGSQPRTQIPFDKIGHSCEIVCERGITAIPLLTPIINLTMMNKGLLPIHASAFIYKHTGVLVCGWPKGGKTGMLLAFMNQGAGYISDDWVYVRGDDSQMYGLPQQIQIREWYFQFLPQYRTVITWKKRMEMRVLKALLGITGRLNGQKGNGNGLLQKLLKRIHLGIERQLSVHLHPEKLFGEAACVSGGRVDRVFLAVTHASPEIEVCKADHQTLSRKINSQLIHELQTLMSYYLMFRFAFPDKRNETIEQYESLQQQLLSRILAGKEIYDIYHPYEAPLPDIFTRVEPFIKQPVSGS